MRAFWGIKLVIRKTHRIDMGVLALNLALQAIPVATALDEPACPVQGNQSAFQILPAQRLAQTTRQEEIGDLPGTRILFGITGSIAGRRPGCRGARGETALAMALNEAAHGVQDLPILGLPMALLGGSQPISL